MHLIGFRAEAHVDQGIGPGAPPGGWSAVARRATGCRERRSLRPEDLTQPIPPSHKERPFEQGRRGFPGEVGDERSPPRALSRRGCRHKSAPRVCVARFAHTSRIVAGGFTRPTPAASVGRTRPGQAANTQVTRATDGRQPPADPRRRRRS